jgi:hypothetical protein
MHNEEITKTWWNYLRDLFALGGTPPLFELPHCATCSYWFLIDEEGLHHIALTSSPKEYDKIIDGLSGKLITAFKVDGKVEDVYQTHRFYGWCKRFPPVPRGGYSIIQFRSFASLLNRYIHRNISQYCFPLMPEDEWCGEWNKAKWVDSFIKTNTSQKTT